MPYNTCDNVVPNRNTIMTSFRSTDFNSDNCWILTYSGQKFNAINPHPDTVVIEDIAHALSHQCRFSGHSKRFYSVAEHSYLLSLAVPPEYAMAALMHDASEAYLVDVPRPIKPFLTNYYDLEEGVMEAIKQKFDLRNDKECWDAIKLADTRILTDEKYQVMCDAAANDVWVNELEPLNVRVHFWSPEMAKEMFIERFNELLK